MEFKWLSLHLSSLICLWCNYRLHLAVDYWLSIKHLLCRACRSNSKENNPALPELWKRQTMDIFNKSQRVSFSFNTKVLFAASNTFEQGHRGHIWLTPYDLPLHKNKHSTGWRVHFLWKRYYLFFIIVLKTLKQSKADTFYEIPMTFITFEGMYTCYMD